MVPQTLTVATRTSPLARAQTDEALLLLQRVFPHTVFRIAPSATPGDRDTATPLTDPSIPDDFFTRDLDDALLTGKADVAVHSAKDLPRTITDGLTIAAFLPAKDIRDALVLRSGVSLDQPGLRIGTSSPTREEHLKARYPHARTVPIRGTIGQRLAQLDAGDYDAIIVAACALERLKEEARIHGYLPYDPTPQQGRLALVVRDDQRDLLGILRALDVREQAGLVAIVGCPADASLLSQRAREYLEHADLVIHDRLLPEGIGSAIRAPSIAVGKSGGGESTPQSEIHRHMLHAAEQGKLVVRLQGGDPLIFAHLSEELRFLHDWNLRVDLVPTLTASQIAAARALAPLTHRGDGGHVHFLTGHTPEGEKRPVMPGPGEGNLAIYMGVREAATVQAELLTAGWARDESVLIAERLGDREESVRPVSLADLAAADIQRPAVFLVGPKPHPVSPRTLFVGTDPSHFLRYGPLIHWPLIRLESRPLEERAALLQAHWDEADGIIFPSRFAVRSVIEALSSFADTRALNGKRLLAVGPATEEELKSFGLRADASIASYGGAVALVAALGPDYAGTYCYPCSDQAPIAERVALFRQAGIDLRPMGFYENRPVPRVPLPRTPFDRVLFTSSSTVDVYFSYYPEERTAVRRWWAVGPATLRALEALGLDGHSLQTTADR